MSGNPFRGRWSAILFAAGVIWFAASMAEHPPEPKQRHAASATAAPAAADEDALVPAAEPSPLPPVTDPVDAPDPRALANIMVY